jgi:penicillin-binding protein 1A
MLLGSALAHSKNTVSVKLVDALGPDAVASFARRLGIVSDLPRNLTLALGTGEVTPIELVNAYASIAARGFATPPILVRSVRDRDGNVLEETPPVQAWGAAPDGSPVAAADPSTPTSAATAATATAIEPGTPSDPALEIAAGEADPAAPTFAIPGSGTRPDVAYVLGSMMRQVVESGTGAGAKALARPLAAKTGTAQEHRDAWFVGLTPELVSGVWIGFDDHSPLGPRETGAGAALPPWLSFMQAALGARPPADFGPVPGVELVRIDPATGRLASDRQADAPFAAFLAGTAPTESAGPGAAPRNFFLDDH